MGQLVERSRRIGADPALEAALVASTAAGLPAIAETYPEVVSTSWFAVVGSLRDEEVRLVIVTMLTSQLVMP